MDGWFARAHSEGSMCTERPRLTDSGALLPEHCTTRMPLGVPLLSLASVYSSINENHNVLPLDNHSSLGGPAAPANERTGLNC